MKHEVHVTRDGRWWMVEVPALDLLTQARRVSEIEDMATSLIALTLDVPASEVEVEVKSIMVGDIDAFAMAEAVKRAREEAQLAEESAMLAAREAVKLLVDREAPVRDVGELLGVSHQRVSQLAR